MQRQIAYQQDPNVPLTITAHGVPNAAGAVHRYMITGNAAVLTDIRFQNGAPADGVNGITIEALLAVCKDRLESFQTGPFACTENMQAAQFIAGALNELAYRQQKRTARGVAGSLEK